MTDLDIITDWLSLKENIDTLPFNMYTKDDYDSILALCDQYQNGDIVVYKVNGNWQQIMFSGQTDKKSLANAEEFNKKQLHEFFFSKKIFL